MRVPKIGVRHTSAGPTPQQLRDRRLRATEARREQGRHLLENKVFVFELERRGCVRGGAGSKQCIDKSVLTGQNRLRQCARLHGTSVVAENSEGNICFLQHYCVHQGRCVLPCVFHICRAHWATGCKEVFEDIEVPVNHRCVNNRELNPQGQVVDRQYRVDEDTIIRTGSLDAAFPHTLARCPLTTREEQRKGNGMPSQRGVVGDCILFPTLLRGGNMHTVLFFEGSVPPNLQYELETIHVAVCRQQVHQGGVWVRPPRHERMSHDARVVPHQHVHHLHHVFLTRNANGLVAEHVRSACDGFKHSILVRSVGEARCVL
eukprot:PhM_4_TR13915/c0_g1_i1/m.37433